MGTEKSKQVIYAPQLPETITRGNYEAQRQLDFRLTSEESLRIISPLQSENSSTGSIQKR